MRAARGNVQCVPGQGRLSGKQGGNGLRVGVVGEDDAAARAAMRPRTADFCRAACCFNGSDECGGRRRNGADVLQQTVVFAQGGTRVGTRGERLLQGSGRVGKALPQRRIVAMLLAHIGNAFTGADDGNAGKYPVPAAAKVGGKRCR